MEHQQTDRERIAIVKAASAIAVDLARAAPSSGGNYLLGGYIAVYDQRVTDLELVKATRSRFISGHYSDAVVAAVKVLNESVRQRSGSTADGDRLMTSVFSENKPRLRLNRLRSDSDRSEQRDHMLMCQGVVAAWRNPRAHESDTEDEPLDVVAMIEHVQSLLAITKNAVKTRTRK